MSDVIVSYGSGDTLGRFLPQTEAAKRWIDEHVQCEPWQWLGKSLCVEHRYVGPLVEGMEESGLSVQFL